MIWIDAQLSPSIAAWIGSKFNVEAKALRELGLRDAEDKEIFDAAREAHAIVMTKDADFVSLLSLYGPPPQIIWLTCGNTSNANLKRILEIALNDALAILSRGESLVEVR